MVGHRPEVAQEFMGFSCTDVVCHWDCEWKMSWGGLGLVITQRPLMSLMQGD